VDQIEGLHASVPGPDVAYSGNRGEEIERKASTDDGSYLQERPIRGSKAVDACRQ
jgi:hypothetical protein